MLALSPPFASTHKTPLLAWGIALLALSLDVAACFALTSFTDRPIHAGALLFAGLLLYRHDLVLRWRRLSTWVAGIFGAAAFTLVLDIVIVIAGGDPCWLDAPWALLLGPLAAPVLAQLLRLGRERPIAINALGAVSNQATLAARHALWPRVRFTNACTARTSVPAMDCTTIDLSDPHAAIQGSWLYLPLHPEGPLEGMGKAVKRSMDLLITLILAPVVLPLCLLLAALTRLSSPGAGFYSQTRVSSGGKVFIIHKLRTMVLNAEPDGQPVWPQENDPRITLLGLFLRRTWLDELPQLWDVLVGSMSLVGPRPERPAFVQAFSQTMPKYPLRHRVKGGMTGLAQVRGLVGNTPLEKRLRHDLAYARLWSPCLDLWILAATAHRAVCRPRLPPAP